MQCSLTNKHFWWRASIKCVEPRWFPKCRTSNGSSVELSMPDKMLDATIPTTCILNIRRNDRLPYITIVETCFKLSPNKWYSKKACYTSWSWPSRAWRMIRASLSVSEISIHVEGSLVSLSTTPVTVDYKNDENRIMPLLDGVACADVTNVIDARKIFWCTTKPR